MHTTILILPLWFALVYGGLPLLRSQYEHRGDRYRSDGRIADCVAGPCSAPVARR